MLELADFAESMKNAVPKSQVQLVSWALQKRTLNLKKYRLEIEVQPYQLI